VDRLVVEDPGSALLLRSYGLDAYHMLMPLLRTALEGARHVVLTSGCDGSLLQCPDDALVTWITTTRPWHNLYALLGIPAMSPKPPTEDECLAAKIRLDLATGCPDFTTVLHYSKPALRVLNGSPATNGHGTETAEQRVRRLMSGRRRG
jgi:hypothetical protein